MIIKDLKTKPYEFLKNNCLDFIIYIMIFVLKSANLLTLWVYYISLTIDLQN